MEAAPGSRTAIAAEGVVRTFEKIRALDGLDLEIPTGILYGLVGPNGSGKTTLIRILVGLDEATGGRARVLGDAPRDHAREIGYMPQEEALYPDLSVYENLEFFAGLYDAPISRAREILGLVRLWDDRDRLVERLSGGMRRRVSLATALVHDPRVLFMDEPTVGVDPILRTEFWDHFHARAEAGCAILITTHHLEEARRCDRVGFLWRGRLIKEASPAELMESYHTSSLEKAFIGALKEAGLEDHA